MYYVDIENKKLEPLESVSFSNVHFKERTDLQEWLAANPQCLSVNERDELLIIQKEFHGFDKTNERLDLLALDKQGSLVVIELKTDDSGRDVTWQAIKYASYCSTLEKQQIIKIYGDYLGDLDDAEEKLATFFGVDDLSEISLNKDSKPKIILVAAKFRPEITSSVLWLIDSGLKIRCVEVSLYQSEDGKFFLTATQILPTPSTEEYIIKLANKKNIEEAEAENKANLQNGYQIFWQQFLDDCRRHNHFFGDLSPSTSNWLTKGLGKNGVGFQTVFRSTKRCSVNLEMSLKSQIKNKEVFDKLFSQKDEIEAITGKLDWNRSDDTIRSIISIYCDYETAEENYPKIFQFFREETEKFRKAFEDRLKSL